jgi:DNA-binding IclR family transcriptional regulator
MADLERSAKRGYAETRGENVADVMAIARSVQIDAGTYAIVVAGPTHRMTKQVGHHLSRLKNACANIAELA